MKEIQPDYLTTTCICKRFIRFYNPFFDSLLPKLIDGLFNPLQSVFQGSPSASDVHSHEAGSLWPKRGSLVESKFHFINEKVVELVGRLESQLSAVEPNQISGLRFRHFNLGNLFFEVLEHEIQVALQVIHELVDIVLALVVDGRDCDHTKQCRAERFLVADKRVEFIPERLVGNNHCCTSQSWNIECLARVDKDEGVVGDLLAQGGHADVLVAARGKDEIEVDFVREDEDIVFEANVGDSLEFLAGENAA